MELLSCSINEMAGKSFDCGCGKTHSIYTQKIVIQSGAIRLVMDSGLSGAPFVIADENTWPLGESLFAAMPHVVLKGSNIHADDRSLGELLIETSEKHIDYFIALGAGTIGDITRFLAFRLNKPFINVCTAPSMDGAASSHCPLIHNDFKATYQAAPPYAVYFDLDIMRAAPQRMIAAGYADIAGKHIAALDWWLGSLATEEHFCPQIRDLTMRAVHNCEEACSGLAKRDPQAIAKLAEALILSSLAMQLNITSRPASGTEHLISHAWENLSIKRHMPVSLHGDKVGIGTLIACDIYHEFFKEKRATLKSVSNIDFETVLAHWDELREQADRLWSMKEGIALQIKQAGGPTRPSQLGISDEDVRYGFYHMTIGRPRVTIAHLIEAMGLESEIYDTIIPQWVN